MTLIMPILATPFYLKYLGSTLWGVVSLVMLIQIAFVTLEQGFSQALLKEFTTLLHQKNISFIPIKNKLQKYYLYFGVICILAIFALGFFWGYKKLNGTLTNNEQLILYTITGFLVMAQVLSSFNRVILLSAEKHQAVAKINIFIQIFRHAVGISIVYFTANVIGLIGWFALSTIIELILRSKSVQAVYKLVYYPKNILIDKNLMRLILRRSVRMSLSVLLGSLLIYVDRFVVGKTLSIEDLGLYTIASTVSFGVVQLIYPVGQIFLPKLIHSRINNKKVNHENCYLLKWFLILAFVVSLVFLTFGNYLIMFWLQNVTVSERVYSLLKILLIGSFFNSLFNIGYWNWLSKGEYKKVASCFVTCFFVTVIIMPKLVAIYGLKGAAIGWVISNILCFIFSSAWMRDLYEPNWKLNK